MAITIISMNLTVRMIFDFSYLAAYCPAIDEKIKNGSIKSPAAKLIRKVDWVLLSLKAIRITKAFLKILSLKAPKNCVIKKGPNFLAFNSSLIFMNYIRFRVVSNIVYPEYFNNNYR